MLEYRKYHNLLTIFLSYKRWSINVPWYQKSIETICEELTIDPWFGIKTAEVAERQKKYGNNQIKADKTWLLKTLFEPFKNVFSFILVIAVIISLILNEKIDAVIILIIMAINAIVYYFQQFLTLKLINKLKEQTVYKVKVLRDGHELEIIATNLVVGDIIFLSEGQKIPADVRIIESTNLEINESSLTGESTSVKKEAGSIKNNDRFTNKLICFSRKPTLFLA